MVKLYRIVRGKWKHVTCQCNSCHKHFTTLWSLRRHLREVHELIRRGGSLKRGAEPEVREPELRKKPGGNSKLMAKEGWREKIRREKT